MASPYVVEQSVGLFQDYSYPDAAHPVLGISQLIPSDHRQHYRLHKYRESYHPSAFLLPSRIIGRRVKEWVLTPLCNYI